ncbi:hypothetical protein Ahy_B04g069440 [Arachis hypogaea]|uniref:PB1-like domain-containing protein n=1 Tax=Arachis hypogaea TaxID=3818 RepID=A0A444ZCP4_ARAHY|nr:hypothetical protein Ahy_B04g069440 [Arachis hypogaea]
MERLRNFHPCIDVDFVNKKDLEEHFRGLGYPEYKEIYWLDPAAKNLEFGLHMLKGDQDINDMCEATLSCPDRNEFYIYFEHPVSQPMAVEPEPEPKEEPVVFTDDSSSDNRYESAEDEAYKPPPPGYETDSCDIESPKRREKKTKENASVSPSNKKKVSPKKNGKKSSKRYTGKRRKRHVLYGESSKENRTETPPIAAISRLRIKAAEDFVSPYLTMDAVRKTYDLCVNPVNSKKFWEKTNHPKPQPPRIVRLAGRPKKRQTESGAPLPPPPHKCGEKGYYYKTCKGAPVKPDWQPKRKKAKEASKALVVMTENVALALLPIGNVAGIDGGVNNILVEEPEPINLDPLILGCVFEYSQ